MAQRETVEVRWSKTAEAVARVLVEQGYVAKTEKTDHTMVVTLKYEGRAGALSDIGRVSRPGSRVYVGYKDIPRIWGGVGMVILSTPAGVLADKTARKQKLGGEVICFVR